MTTNDAEFDKLFTVEQANNMLPLVRAIVTDLAQLYQELVDRQQRLDHLTAGREHDSGDPYSDELREMEAGMERDRQRLRGFVQELRELGVQCKDPAQGLIDFPSQMDDRIVYLCWKLGEPEVLYWHELDAGFAGRQSLAAGTAIGEGEAGLGVDYGEGN